MKGSSGIDGIAKRLESDKAKKKNLFIIINRLRYYSLVNRERERETDMLISFFCFLRRLFEYDETLLA